MRLKSFPMIFFDKDYQLKIDNVSPHLLLGRNEINNKVKLILQKYRKTY